MISPDIVISQTQQWIRSVVIACNFCPFAAREVKRNSVRYEVCDSEDLKVVLSKFLQECIRLDDEKEIETTLIIFPASFRQFRKYLDLVELSEKLLKKEGYEGVYQVASFHPDYQFSGSSSNDAANFTNRSIYPMLHLLREESIEKALERYPDPEGIPQRNIDFARSKGEAYMKMLRDSCL